MTLKGGVTALLVDLRCWRCRRLLLRYALERGSIEVKCSSCNAMTTVEH